MRPVAVKQFIIKRYLSKVAPQKEFGQPLSQMDKAIDLAIESASKGDYKTYLKCEEEIGKYQLLKHRQ